MTEELDDTILENAQGPAEGRGDSFSMKQHPLPDQIKADKYLAGKGALADRTKKTMGVRFVQLVPPGGV